MTKRVVSLVPSSTETLLALGADVVACSRFCEQPDLLHVGGTKNPDIDAIVELAPDLVVLDREENRIEDHDALVAAGLDVFVSDVTDLDGALAVVPALADAADIAHSGFGGRRGFPGSGFGGRRGFPGSGFGGRREIPGSGFGGRREIPRSGERRTAFVPIWRRPWMTIGAATYGASLLEAVGVDVIGFGVDAYPTVELGDVAAARPDLVLVPSEPYEFSDSHLDELRTAVPDATVVRMDGQDLFWWGVRTPAALNRLAVALVPRPTP